MTVGREARAGMQPLPRSLPILFLALLFVITRGEDNGKNKITLTFLIDSTGSMSDDIHQVKVAMQDIFDYLQTHRADEIENYALVEFNDPDAKLMIITSDAAKYRSKLASIRVDGGGDCPEMALAGLKIALESSLPYSYIYVFTDASAKDYLRKQEIENIIQRKKSKIVFVLTGKCGSESQPDYQVYHSIARISNGHVFHLYKGEVHKVLEFIKLDAGKKQIIDSGTIASGRTSLQVPVDVSVKEFSVTVTTKGNGPRPKIDIKNPDGVLTPGKTILTLPSVVSKQVKNPEPGNWTAQVSASSPGQFVITAETTFNFKYGFSLKPTEEIVDTAPRPLAGIKNELLIQLVNNSNPMQLTEVKVKDKNNKVLMIIKLHPLRNKNGIYKGDAFLPPNFVFLLEVHGKDVKNNPVVRLSDSGITPQQPSQPIITLPTELTTTLKSPFTLSCHVESLVPFTGSWYKGGIKIVPGSTFQQSTKMLYNISNTAVSTEGIYRCQATNQAGTSSKEVKVKVKGPPPSVKAPNQVFLILNQVGEIPCRVESDAQYEIKWTKTSTTGLSLPVHASNVSVKNGHMIIAYVDKGDQGTYVCSAKSIFGEGKSEVHVEVLEPTTVTVSPDQQFIENESFQISCQASGTLPIDMVWKKDGVRILESDERLRRMDGNVLLYSVKKSQKSDQGIYECKATNKANSASGITKLKFVQVVPQIERKEESGEKVLIVGEATELPCKIIQGIPQPTLTWYKDGEKLVESDRALRDAVVFTNGSLVLSYAKPENEGVYECVAENVAGKARKAFYVTVLEPPTFDNENRNIFKIKPGYNVSLPCEVYGNPKPTIIWRKDDANMTSSNIALTSDHRNIFIKSSTPENNGTYECIATNGAGRNVHYIDLFVQGAPRILPQSTSMYPNKGDEITLKCVVIAYPIAKIKWFKNGSPYNNHVSYEENHSSIRIHQADLSSSGKYECIASNEGGRDNLTITVSVTVPPSFKTNEEFITVSKSETVTLSCETDAVPPAKYSWMKFPDEHPSVNTSSITFENVDSNFAGLYLCEAENIAGYAQKRFTVIVYTPPRIEAYIPEKYVVQIGRNFSVNCFAEGYPIPTIRWLRNGKNISHVKEGLLNIENIAPDDEGIYTCVAENYEGTDQRNVQIIVEVPPKMDEVFPPVVEANEADSITISCPAMSGFPPPIVRWAKDGEEISATKRIIPKDKNLKLKRLRLDDGGIYSCIASNRAGVAQANITVDVLKPPLFLGGKYHEKLIGNVGKAYKLDCSNSGKPTPKVSWFRNNHTFLQFLSPKSTMESNNNILKINNATKNDEGMYKCVVENNAGSTERTFDLKLLMSRQEEGDEDGPSEWGEWSPWSQCSSPCGQSEQVRFRRCQDALNRCSGDSEEWRKCNVGGCKVDGSWSKWGPWSECTVTCGSSVRYRERSCTNPPPLYGGDLCFGANRQHETCNKVPCPIDGGWSQWSKWQTCIGSCTKSTMKRERRCNNPYASFGGKPCSGPTTEYKQRAMSSCPVNGGWSEWSPWSPCSASCGPSQSFRERSCNNPVPKLNGLPCEGSNIQTRKCETPTCDNIPLHLSLKFIGSLNGKDIPENLYSVNVTDLEDVREVKSVFLNPVKKRALPVWYPLLPHIFGPVTWLTAFQRDKAVNGYTLTKGVFEMQTIITFKTGENISVYHIGSGLGSDGVLNIQAYIEGTMPLLNIYMVKMDSYEETYIQIEPGEVFVTAQNSLEYSGVPIPYSWSKVIKYKKDLGSLPSLTEKLTVRSIQTRRRNHKQEGMISPLSKHCPRGFQLSEQGFCLDVDECSNRRLHNCHPSQSCINVIGSYKCHCPFGFKASRKGEICADINECAIHPSVCSHWCENFQGGFKCLCPPGLAVQESKTKCTDILSKPNGTYGDRSSVKVCLPSQREQDGICRDIDPCTGSHSVCKEGEICVNKRRLAVCIPLPCPDGFRRFKNTQCIKDCNIKNCETRANISETISHIILKQEGPIPPFVNLTDLKWDIPNHRDEITFHIVKNEKGKPFNVRSVDGIGHLLTTQFLPPGRTYSIEVLASVYNQNGSRILHTNKFLITIHSLDVV